LGHFQPQVHGLRGAWSAHNQVKQNDACIFARYMKRLAANRLAAMLAQKFHYVPPVSVEMTIGGIKQTMCLNYHGQTGFT
jgi:hypothetical protein